jgi:cyclopropane-fatty-acyl-phospholipid synthase
MSLELTTPSPCALASIFVGRGRDALLSGIGPAIARGSIRVRLPDRRLVAREGAEPGPAAELYVHRWRALRRIAVGGAVGLAEAIMEGEAETPDLKALLAFALANEAGLGARMRGGWAARLARRAHHLLRANTRRGSRRNIAAHYDLGNDFYRLWLDETMSYSAALFETPDESLAKAQHRKYRQIAAMAGIEPGMKVLEVGCGWGGFAEFAARELGCHVTGLTLSPAQRRYTLARLEAAGLAGQTEIRLQDYRDCRGRFDAVVSIEMFEAIGERNWPGYFARVADWLAPEGRAALQIITIAEDRFATYRGSADFIQHYIFPGGMLPPPSAVLGLAAEAGLESTGVSRFGADYARTLAHWRRSFTEQWGEIRAHGFDDRFRRMWEFYLDYCAIGFEFGTIDVAHFGLARMAGRER